MASQTRSLVLLEMTPSFWRGKSVLVTGHTGLKGGWLSLWLQHMGALVHGYSLPPSTTPSLFEVAQVGTGISHIEGNILDLQQLKSAMATARPEIVMHLAAQALVRQSYRDPLETLSTNVLGTANLLEAARHTPSIKAILVITTDKCYENQEWLWPYRENEALGGRDPYSASKACAEIVTGAWRDSFLNDLNIAVATARAGNVIGGGDWASDRLVPDAMRAWQNDETLKIRHPDAVRPWQHVLDPLAGYLKLAEALIGSKATGAWNFGPTDMEVHTVGMLLERLSQLWGSDAKWQAEEGMHPHEAGLLRLDSSKARNLLGWRSKYDLDSALQLTVDWQRQWMRGGDMRQFSVQQIEQYMAA